MELNHTHDANTRSWLESANAPGTDFPIQNLPFGVFSTKENPSPRAGVALARGRGQEQIVIRQGREVELAQVLTRMHRLWEVLSMHGHGLCPMIGREHDLAPGQVRAQRRSARAREQVHDPDHGQTSHRGGALPQAERGRVTTLVLSPSSSQSSSVRWHLAVDPHEGTNVGVPSSQTSATGVGVGLV